MQEGSKGDWKVLYGLIKNVELEKARQYLAASPIAPNTLTQILFKCIDGFGDDQKLSSIVEFLIEKGADVSARRGGDFKSSLHLALLRNKMITAAVIVSRLDMASRREKLSRLLLKIMEENISDEQRSDMVGFLITQGADVNVARQTDLMTPLHIEMRRNGLAESVSKTMEV